MLADIGPEVQAALAGQDAALPDDPLALLDRVFDAAPSFYFREGPLTVRTDRRWYSTLPEAGAGAPLLVLRRWPGDSVAAFYLLDGAFPTEPGAVVAPPPFPDAAVSAATRDGGRRWELTLPDRLGERRAEWLERPVPEAAFRLGVLLVPGDAGLGPETLDDRWIELRAVAGRVEIQLERTVRVTPLPAGTAAAVPDLGDAPGRADEGADPWQVAQGHGFTLGMPPGLKVKRLRGVPAPQPVPGQVLWIRGRFIDRDGTEVAVGDGRRAGYVAEVASPASAWRRGHEAPLGAPGARRVSGEEFDVAREATGCREARAERWQEPGFDGDWLVFRLGFSDRGVEIGLPVAAGRESLALFWIPLTWRPGDRPPAPPPIDAAARFGIRFEKLQGRERRTHPMTEGYLAVPGLRMQIAKGWWVIANLRSTDGFPVQIVDSDGNVAGRLVRLDLEQIGPIAPDEGWMEEKRPRSYGAQEVRRRRDGTWLYLTPYGYAFRLEPLELDASSAKVWDRSARTVQLNRPRK